MNRIKNAYQLSEAYTSKRNALLESFPFYFNVLDEVGVNENAHSRVLGKIFSYRRGNRFIYLESFLKSIALKLNVDQPRILIDKGSVEGKGRIDIGIYDKDFAIIIENKIHYAPDQCNQINNYVEQVEGKGYSLKKIYILYLTRFGWKEPWEKSISKKKIESFGERYKPINFNDNIYPWLSEEVLPRCKESEIDFKEGLQQYINHLDRLLFKKDKFKKMNQELVTFLTSELQLSNNSQGVLEDQEKIANKLNDLRQCIGHLESMENGITENLRKDFLSLLYDKLQSLSPNWYCVNRVHDKVTIEEANENYFGFRNDTLKFRDTQLPFLVEIQNKTKFLCGFFSHDETLKKEIVELFKAQGIEMKAEKGGWIAYDLSEYDYKDRKPAWYVYDKEWNGFFVNEQEGITNMFFSGVSKVYSAWEEICALNQG